MLLAAPSRVEYACHHYVTSQPGCLVDFEDSVFYRYKNRADQRKCLA